jgi:hypothetical protein
MIIEQVTERSWACEPLHPRTLILRSRAAASPSEWRSHSQGMVANSELDQLMVRDVRKRALLTMRDEVLP